LEYIELVMYGNTSSVLPADPTKNKGHLKVMVANIIQDIYRTIRIHQNAIKYPTATVVNI